MDRINLNRCLWVIGTLCFIVHFAVLMSYSLNIPMWDEWDLLRQDGLARRMSVPWLFELHNEHRIVLTKLLTWVLLWVNGWNLNTNIAINFAVYAAFTFLLLKTIEHKFNVALGLVLILMGSSLPWQNHYHPFQSQFHFFLLFFFAAVMLALRYDSWSWLSALCAILSAFSFSSGVICAGVFILLCVTLSFLRPSLRFRYLLLAGVTALAIGLWFIGFHKNPGHPALGMPWERIFWDHYLNALSLGFGYLDISDIPGILLLMLLVGLSIWRILTLKDLPDDEKGDYIGIIAIICGILGSLASISMARAAFGPEQAKSSRYAEVAIILLPMLWVLVQAALSKAPEKARKIIIFGMILLLIAPFHNDFRWKKVYRTEYKQKLTAQECIRSYYNGQGDGNCPMTYPGGIKDRLDRAKELGILFSSETN